MKKKTCSLRLTILSLALILLLSNTAFAAKEAVKITWLEDGFVTELTRPVQEGVVVNLSFNNTNKLLFISRRNVA